MAELAEDPAPGAEVAVEEEVKEKPKEDMDFLFDDVKKKKKSKKAKAKPPPKPSKREYENALMDLNTTLSELRKRASKVDRINQEYVRKLVETDEIDNDVSEHLTRIQKKKHDLLTIEEEYNIEINRNLMELQTETKNRISELTKKFDKNQKYLKTDIEILGSKLKTLCRISGQKDNLIDMMSNVNIIAKDKDKRHQDLVYAQHQKNVVIRNNIAEQAKTRYARVSSDFILSREVRSAAYTRRLLSENRELRKEYNIQIPINLRVEKVLTRLRDSAGVVKETYMLTKEITDRLEKTQQKRSELLEKLTKSYNHYRLQIITGSKYRKMYEAVKEYERKESLKYVDEKHLLTDLEQQSAVLYEKYIRLKEAEKEYVLKREKYDQILDVIREAAPELCKATGSKEEFFKNSDDYIVRRNQILGCLSYIITSECRPPRSKAMLKAKYYKGYLGIMPLDQAYCNMLRRVCCKSSSELDLVPSYCQRDMEFKIITDEEVEEEVEYNDPAMLCTKI